MSPTPIIIAGKGPSCRLGDISVSINLPSRNVGTYALTSSGIHTILYVDTRSIVQYGAGTINITANANNLLTGNFSATVTDLYGITRPITGNFTNTPIEP